MKLKWTEWQSLIILGCNFNWAYFSVCEWITVLAIVSRTIWQAILIGWILFAAFSECWLIWWIDKKRGYIVSFSFNFWSMTVTWLMLKLRQTIASKHTHTHIVYIYASICVKLSKQPSLCHHILHWSSLCFHNNFWLLFNASKADVPVTQS